MLAAACACGWVGGWAGDAFGQGTVATDRAALEAFHDATGGDDWDCRTNWTTSAPLAEWYGVGTDANGRVVALSLTRNGLTGQIPSDLGDLDRLEELWLTANDLSGEIPSSLGDLENLEVLSLAANRLSGSIPLSLTDMPGLEQLNLNGNSLSASIPAALDGLSDLVDLSLHENGLTGAIPSGMGDLSGLRWLDLGGNSLVGAAPDALADLAALESLRLAGNGGLSGLLPLGLASLGGLQSVDIRNTGLCGSSDAAFRAWAASIDYEGCLQGGGGGGGFAGGGNGDGGGEDDGAADAGGSGTGGGGGAGGGGGPPRAAFTHGLECTDGLCRAKTGSRVIFGDASSGTVRQRRWSFGDGGTSRRGTVAHRWSSPGFYEVVLWVSDGTREATLSQVVLVEAAAPEGTCKPDEQTRCLRRSRFSVVVDWWLDDATAGRGTVVRAGTDDSGVFRFFDADNWEVLIKVLDGCALNGSVWVFGASTTNLGYSIRVTDTATGLTKKYSNEPGLPAPAIADTSTFRRSCAP